VPASASKSRRIAGLHSRCWAPVSEVGEVSDFPLLIIKNQIQVPRSMP
jgi:hypothetical protein